MTPFKRFYGLLRQYKSEIKQIYLYALFIGIVNLTLPIGVQAIINFLQTGELTSTWVLLVVIVIIGVAVTGFLQILQLRVVENVQQDLFARSAFEFAYRLPRIIYLKFDKIYAPELVNRFFDTMTIQKGLPKILIDFSQAIFQIIFGLLLLSIYSPYFILLGTAMFILVWLIYKLTGKVGLETSLMESNYKYKLAHWLEEIARLANSFKLIPRSKLHLEKTDYFSSKYLEYREEHFQVLLKQFKFFVTFRVFLVFGLLFLGGLLVFQEQLNLGQFVAAEIVIILIINSIEKIIRLIDIIYDVLTGLEKIGIVTDMDLDNNNGQIDIDNETELKVVGKNIRFKFPDEERWLLDNISFEINKSDRILLEGKPGSGKSLLLGVISGLYKINEGELYINDHSYNVMKKESVYDNVHLTQGQDQLFNGTLRENIVMGRQIEDRDLNDVINQLGLKQYIAQLPKGIESEILSTGKRMSRSIVQKIILARSVVGKPKLLLLENPLQFLNKEDRNKIIDYLTDEKNEWALVVVSDFDYWKGKCNKKITLANA